MKKFISLVLALVMALSLTTIAWGAATPVSDVAGLQAAIAADGTIELTADITAPLDIGKSDGTVARNIVIDLKGNTLTLGPAIGSTGTETNGMRVLANSIVEIKNGTIAFSELQNAQGKHVLVGIANYGTLTLTDVEVKAGSTVMYTINNRGALTLAGTTSVANGGAGDKIAITNDPYNYIYTDFDASLTIDSAAVSVGTVQVELYGNTKNNGDVVLNISAGYVEEIVDDGASNVDVVGNITGGSFGTPPDESYLAAGVELDNGVVVPKGGASVTAKAYKMTSNGTLVPGDVNAIYAPAVAAVLNDDGKQTNTADISHYTFEGVNCVVAASLADADFVLYSDAAGKNVMMYLKAAVTSYNGTGAVYANFGKACGQVTYTAEVGKTYYTTNANGDAGIYVADKEGTKALMVGGKLVLVKAAPVAYTTAAVKHAAVPTVKDGKVTGYTCATCKTVAVEAPNFMSIPKGAVQDGLPGNWYWPVAVVTPSTDKVTSAETFDAGIAMYVGMSVMAAAGSAVVLKKKD